MQTGRLALVGYLSHVLSGVMEFMLRGINSADRVQEQGPSQGRRTVVVPYMQKLSHNLKQAAQHCDITVAFSASEKLSRLCRVVNAVLETKICTKLSLTILFLCRERKESYILYATLMWRALCWTNGQVSQRPSQRATAEPVSGCRPSFSDEMPNLWLLPAFRGLHCLSQACRESCSGNFRGSRNSEAC